MIKKLICILTLIFLTSCLNNKELREGWWKYGDGYHIGDVISFERYNLINNTLYLENIPKALLISKEESVFGFTSRKIVIKDLESNKRGTYYQK
ncbi:hypothetical protein [uncultured Lacinutrix sp.]|uniref:hypothetical protein n=1 Tax=uncultured Lacinutrix sp. TaxID=574032 RepID=UPI002607D932|nr:hypothetical protein [uncultured Lacinutrix sp.]